VLACRPILAPWTLNLSQSRPSGSNHKSAADDSPNLNTPLLLFPCILLADWTHASPSTAIMIPTSCAWARLGCRRIPTFPPRHRISGNTSESGSAFLRTSPSQVTRRFHVSKLPVAQKAPATASTIPGPSWLWLEPIYGPFRAYGRVQQRKPYMTQLISSLVIYFVGDLVAQSISEPVPSDVLLEEGEKKGWVQEWSDNRDWHRTGRSLIIGGLSSIPAYRWFLWLGNNFNYGSKILSLTTKVYFTWQPSIL
jgi:protein Mpv17